MCARGGLPFLCVYYLGMAGSMRVHCRRVECILALNTTGLLTCGMEGGAPVMSSIFACAVTLSLATRTSTSYPSGTGRLASLSLIRYANLNQSNLKTSNQSSSYCRRTRESSSRPSTLLTSTTSCMPSRTKTAYTYMMCAVINNNGGSNRIRKRKRR